MISALKNAFRNYINFQGRAGKGEYWWFVLSVIVLEVIIAALTKASSIFGIIGVLVYLALLLPGLAVAVRRLHDTDRSGAWILITFIPLIGSIWLLILLLQKGNVEANRYGMPAHQLTR